MNKNLTTFFNTARAALKKHSPEILIGLGITGFIGSTVLAVKATPKALKAIEEEKERQGVEKLSAKDTVKVAWKPYIPAAISSVTAAGCIIGANSIHVRRRAALATAYTLSETALREYKEKVIETVGEKKAEAIQDKIDKENLDKHPVSRSEVILANGGTSVCFDEFSKRYFYSDHETIRRIQNDLNEELLNGINGWVTLNELYLELGLEPLHPIGDDMGWWADRGKIKMHIGSGLTDDNRPCLVISHENPPGYGI